MNNLHQLVLPLAVALPVAAQTGININHARTGTATQSGVHPTYPAAVASRVIDGNRSGVWAHDSSNTTAIGAAPWVQVTLSGPSLVHEIALFPRADAANTSTSDLLVELKSGATVVWSQRCCTGGGHPARGLAVRLLLPPGGLTGDAVRVSRPNVASGVITLAEIEVVQVAPITPVNWALYGTATSTGGTTQYPATLAIDGNTDGHLPNNSCAMTSVNGASGTDSWQVVLPRGRYDAVRVWPSQEAGPVGTYYVTTFDGPTLQQTIAVTTALPTAPMYIALAGGNIDRVRLGRASVFAPLLLAEVEVLHFGALDAEATPFGSGCAGSAGVPTLRQLTAPLHASNFDVTLRNLPPAAGVAFLVTGISRTQHATLTLPFDLIGLGAAGCQAYASLDLTQLLATSGGTANSTLTIPNLGWIIGLELHQQGFVLDPAANALGITVSNALRVRIGL